ncbi:hypothetical protein TNCV_2174892 [Trichonephila clavipes]|nr:hypothetical protein TNCV_2174892 [Trichonephila clavipes]
MSRLGDEILLITDRISFLELALTRMKVGTSKKTQNDFDHVTSQIDEQKKALEHQTGQNYQGIPEDSASNADEHREITAFLKEKGEEFHAIDPIEVRPQKIVIKGLPISTDIDAIRDDLTERGFNVIKVAQLTSTSSATVQKGVSFAKVLSNDKENQMAPPSTRPSRPNRNPRQPQPSPKRKSNKNSPKNVASENFGFMDAILELKKFLTDYPSLRAG